LARQLRTLDVAKSKLFSKSLGCKW